MDYSDISQRDVELLRHEGSQRAMNALPHFGAGRDDGHARAIDDDVWGECELAVDEGGRQRVAVIQRTEQPIGADQNSACNGGAADHERPSLHHRPPLVELGDRAPAAVLIAARIRP